MLLLILLVLSGIVFFVGRLIDSSLLSVNRVIPLMWIFMIIVPVAFWGTAYEWQGEGLVWLLLAMLCMELGAILCGKRTLRKLKKELPIEIEDNYLNFGRGVDEGRTFDILVPFMIFLGLVGVVGQVYLAGYSIKDFLSFDSLVKMTTEVAYNRYYGETRTSIVTQLLGSFTYLAALVGGYAFNYSYKKKHRLYCILTFLPIVVNMLYANTKSGFISNIFLWFTGWCISKIWIDGRLPKVSSKVVIGVTVGFLLFSLLMVFVMVLRTGDFSASMFSNRIDEYFVYAFGGTAGFDYWYLNGDDVNSFNLGANTYLSISKQLGYQNIDNYDNFFEGLGNIYTAFRGVVMDFGKIGGLIFCFLRGFIGQLAHNNIEEGNNYPFGSMVILMCMYFWGFYSFLISSWRYTSYIILIVLFYIFLFFYHKRYNALVGKFYSHGKD